MAKFLILTHFPSLFGNAGKTKPGRIAAWKTDDLKTTRTHFAHWTTRAQMVIVSKQVPIRYCACGGAKEKSVECASDMQQVL